MAVKEIFSKRLKILREEKGISQTELAEKIGVSRGSISFYENGDRLPDIEILGKIQEYFSVDYDFLLGKSNFKTKEREKEQTGNWNKLQKLFASLSPDLADILVNDLIKILEINDKNASKALIWNVVLTIGFHLRILDLYQDYCQIAESFGDAFKKHTQLKLDLQGYMFAGNKNAEEVYYLIQNSFNSQALNEAGYIYEETQKMVAHLYDEICKRNELKQKYGNKYKFKLTKLADYPYLSPDSIIKNNQKSDNGSSNKPSI
jgi:transcriptional regulator with XRE-family HTH domain